MKIPVNKIHGWQKVKSCLPVLDKLVIIQEKHDQYKYRLATLTQSGSDDDDKNPYFLCWGDSDGGYGIEDVARWAYIEVR